MKLETELKYSLNPQQEQQLLQLPAIKKASNYSHNSLLSTYYDSQHFTLFHNQYVLRVRKKSTSFIQTVKRWGTVNKGLHQRPEWEWPLASATPQCDLFPEPDIVHNQSLQPIFITEFERSSWIITQDNATIECCCDKGFVYLPEGEETLPIMELELELINGSIAGLNALAFSLVKPLNLQPLDESKAEKGFNLCLNYDGIK